MQCGRMLVHRGCRLGAAVADDTIETQRGHGVLAQRAFEGCATVHRFGCVISHVSIIVLSRSNNLRALGVQPLAAQTRSTPNRVGRARVCDPARQKQSSTNAACQASDTRYLAWTGQVAPDGLLGGNRFFPVSRVWPHGLSVRPQSHPSLRHLRAGQIGRRNRHLKLPRVYKHSGTRGAIPRHGRAGHEL
jgi:hypothetical protein